MHSLLNVLRFCQLGEQPAACRMPRGARLLTESPLHPNLCAEREGEAPLLGQDGLAVLHECRELDYMTHIVLRMFENTKWVEGWCVCVCGVCVGGGGARGGRAGARARL
jgi:hypothetical protein